MVFGDNHLQQLPRMYDWMTHVKEHPFQYKKYVWGTDLKKYFNSISQINLEESG